MPENPYHTLAQQLDAIPNGFPTTESGVELKLLAKIFTPEEALLASEMRQTLEPAEVIAARAGMDPQWTYRTLKSMVRKGQIRVGRTDKKLVFGLMPFAVGIYEEQLPRMDEELAQLFEEYYREAQGGFTRYAPAVHRVIPVGEAIPADVEIYPYERASDLIENAKAWGVRDCICRLQQKLIGKGCDRPLESCLIFAPVEGVFDRSETTRAISKEEALDILRLAEDAGLVHSPGNFRDGHNYICNCCTCCCGVLRSVAEFSVPTAIASSDFVAVVDVELCAGCGDCVARCQFGALAVPDDRCLLDAGRCVGCGLCVTVCPSDALRLARRTEGRIPPPPENLEDWMAQRAQSRGLPEMT
ncbi:MAG TPA: 4Fe-4S binding protein [Anaerolineae bacterium]|nr:4Fe-4S binding protein [Anaerolineae bacterium]